MGGALPLITQMMYIGGTIPLINPKPVYVRYLTSYQPDDVCRRSIPLINPEHIYGRYLTSYHPDDVYRRCHTS
jgi:hypothetical protein